MFRARLANSGVCGDARLNNNARASSQSDTTTLFVPSQQRATQHNAVPSFAARTHYTRSTHFGCALLRRPQTVGVHAVAAARMQVLPAHWACSASARCVCVRLRADERTRTSSRPCSLLSQVTGRQALGAAAPRRVLRGNTLVVVRWTCWRVRAGARVGEAARERGGWGMSRASGVLALLSRAFRADLCAGLIDRVAPRACAADPRAMGLRRALVAGRRRGRRCHAVAARKRRRRSRRARAWPSFWASRCASAPTAPAFSSTEC